MNKFFYHLLFILLSFSAFAQNESAATEAFVECVESQYGTSSLLVNGRLYRPQHVKANGSPYFSDEWETAVIYINGSAYDNETIKYNLAQDQLILKKTLKNGNSYQILLHENLVDSFAIDQRLFVSKARVYEAGYEKGYLEKIYAGSFVAYLKQGKFFEAVFSNKYPNGAYLPATSILYFKTPDKIQTISNQHEFFAYFKANKSAIKKFMKRNNIKFNKATQPQLFQLLNFIDHAS